MSRGPVPKPDGQRARRNKTMSRTVTVQPAQQPETGNELHPMAQRWWESWKSSPLTDSFTDLDWVNILTATQFLSSALENDDTKALDACFKIASKYGATMEDRLRMRITVSVDDPAPTRSPGSGVRLAAIG